MKKLLLIPSITLLMVACSKPAATSNPRAELDSLIKEEQKIKERMSILEEELAKGKKENKIPVSVLTATPITFKNYIEVLGKVDSDDNISLSCGIPGTITKINVKVGDNVKKGQVLAETDDGAIRQQMLDLQANIDLIEQVYERQKSLWDLKIGTEMQFLKAKADKESVSKKMAALQEQIRMTKIISPIAGTIDAIDIKIGQAASPGMPCIRVVNYANLKVKADVAEKYASKIKKGAEAIIHLPDMDDGDSLVTKVNFVSRSINPVNRTFNVEVVLDGKKDYHPNMIANLSINDYKSSEPVLVIPVKVIQKDSNNDTYVFLAERNKAKKQVVSIGKEYKGQAEIISGLKDGDLVLDSGYDIVHDGDLITYKK